jgi:hypothetical protein
LEILPDEVEVRLEAHPGLAVAAEGAYVAALNTALTPALVREGLAREFVRRAQELRKQADLDVADRIRLFVTSTPDLAGAIRAHRETIMGETLAVELNTVEPPEGATLAEAWFDGQWMKIGLVREENNDDKIKHPSIGPQTPILRKPLLRPPNAGACLGVTVQATGISVCFHSGDPGLKLYCCGWRWRSRLRWPLARRFTRGALRMVGC